MMELVAFEIRCEEKKNLNYVVTQTAENKMFQNVQNLPFSKRDDIWLLYRSWGRPINEFCLGASMYWDDVTCDLRSLYVRS